MNSAPHPWSRRAFVRQSTLAAGALAFAPSIVPWAALPADRSLSAQDLPRGVAPAPVPSPHFPDRVHAFIWRNWTLVPVSTMARVLRARPNDVLRTGRRMGLMRPPRISRDQWRRSYISIIKRNWHLLPYEQLLELLEWSPEEMAYALREDDFLYVKLGNQKPTCEPLRYAEPDAATVQRSAKIAQVLREEYPRGMPGSSQPLFHFVRALSDPPAAQPSVRDTRPCLLPRFCYSYFALYGDPLLEPELDPYPDGYLARMEQAGVDGVWLQGLLSKLAPFRWDASLSARHEERLRHLGALVARACKRGMGIYLYLNEPRSMPLRFFSRHPGLTGVVEGEHAALCTSLPEVRDHLTESTATLCRAVPDLAGLFTITASENLTNCWSHGAGKQCPRCGARSAAAVIAEVNSCIQEGIRRAGTSTRLFAWDWGWSDTWAADAIGALPREATLMSVSEWSLPIERGGVATEVGEYSISSIGPGPRAKRHWQIARERGLRTVAKIQAGNTWELSAVPYIPALENVAQHVARLREAGIEGLMLGWTLGGYPSPNLEVVRELAHARAMDPDEAMHRVAQRRFGPEAAPYVVAAWKRFSTAFSEFPYHGGLVYSAPLQVGPANPLWAEPTGFTSSMVGFPYDDLDGWRAVYPAHVFISQFEKVAGGFADATRHLRESLKDLRLERSHATALAQELDVAEAVAVHYQSVANQARFVRDRRALREAPDSASAERLRASLREVVRHELKLAKQLHAIQCRDSRMGFEASNHYFYVPQDLLEKVINCRDLLDRWLKG